MKAIMFGFLMSLVSFGISSAAVLSMAPSSAAVLPDDGSGAARVALRFDLSGVPWGSGRQIIVANVDWAVEGLSQEGPVTFTVSAITEGWESEPAQSGASAVHYANEPADTWMLDDLAYEWMGGFLRFRVPDLVNAWLETPASNHGILITFEDEAPVNLGTQLSKAKLNIHYVIIPADQ